MHPDKRIARTAEAQHGVVTAAQAFDAGLTRDGIRHRRKTGRWMRLHRGVYAIAGSRKTFEQNVLAAVLAVGSRAAASHTTAGMLLGLVEQGPAPIHITAPERHRNRRGLKLHEASLTKQDVRRLANIPTTSPNRSIVDLAGVVTVPHLESALDSAIIRGMTSVASLRRYVADRNFGRNAGAGVLRGLLDDRTKGVPESELERLFLRKLKRSGLPEPARQHQVGRRRVDFAYVDAMVAIELDGQADHASGPRFRDDRRRQNELVLAGWLPLRFTWDDVHDRWADVEQKLRRASS